MKARESVTKLLLPLYKIVMDILLYTKVYVYKMVIEQFMAPGYFTSFVTFFLYKQTRANILYLNFM
jgi:hypothetical protein